MMDAMSTSLPGQGRREGPLTDLLASRTYRTALYVALALPLGGLVFGLLVGGALAGVLTLPLLVGAAFLLGTLWLVPGLADVQRWLAGLLGLRFSRVTPPPVYAGVLPWLRATLADAATYRALMFHLLQLPLAAVCWIVLGTLLGASLAALAAPWWAARPEVFPLTWNGGQVTLTALGAAGLLLAGLGGLLVTAGVLNLLGRVWAWLAYALLSAPLDEGGARREVAALRRAAGRVALGDDLGATLADLAGQARAASTARAVALTAPDGTLRAASGPDHPALHGPGASPPAGGADVRYAAGGVTLATLPVVAGGADGGTLRALYAPGTQPGPEELAFLLSIADHAGTALHAAELIRRASERAEEQERARLARELHDSVAQALYGITLGAKTARATLGRDPEKTRASLDYTIRLAEGGVSEMKALLFSLRPDALEEGGLIAALTQNAHALGARHGLTLHADLGREPSLSPAAQAAAYRVAQEALHNVVKHARASQVWLSVREEAGLVTVEVRDDGRGFDPAALPGGTLGQRSMRERAQGAGGTLDVQSRPGTGTTVTLTLPADRGEGGA
ncbi:sensor histidine kinase [Deinococcus metallilatus]|uniref:Oxygen sensor histidine kinase NreB n=1 Tax=Deinococcus metallilatus TaxID=1211322 RepID=A0AAJ5K0J0_9DEIO|nr:sensor histidine kinase [Deinococcus metallilatus]MBB5294790.1 signal transduction histidine kinase [Deinococcus metallilatus]QBY09488.1 sensor histidine kinase [Deinococcus metallilatus]RXJ09493.1 sensor histidine kinase [Deinococcus metallilatus]TLK29015.1 sensor histidine kinase [Deinococcus metallilatus]GMA16716.1 histidine kinase [Deinococcus metallilatus]